MLQCPQTRKEGDYRVQGVSLELAYSKPITTTKIIVVVTGKHAHYPLHYLDWELVFSITKSNGLHLKTFKCHGNHQCLDVAHTNYHALYSDTPSWREGRG